MRWELCRACGAEDGLNAKNRTCPECGAQDRTVRTTAANDVLDERLRQQAKEGWSADHDDAHNCCELSLAAMCYVDPTPEMEARRDEGDRSVAIWEQPKRWPFDGGWKPKDRRSNLVRAAALLLADIERLDRAASKPPRGVSESVSTVSKEVTKGLAEQRSKDLR